MNKPFVRPFCLAIAGMALLALSACAPMKGYPGPALPAGETAIVRSGPYTDLVSVDGMKISGLSVALLPGPHTIEVVPSELDQPYEGWWVVGSAVKGVVGFVALAGRSYRASVEFAPRSAPGYEDYSAWSWVGSVQDETTGARVAQTASLPLAAYPYSYRGGGIASFSWH